MCHITRLRNLLPFCLKIILKLMQQHSALNYCAPFCVSSAFLLRLPATTFRRQELIDIDLNLKPDFIWDWTVSYPRL